MVGRVARGLPVNDLDRAISNYQDARGELVRLMEPTNGTYDSEPLERFERVVEELFAQRFRGALAALAQAREVA